MRDGMDRSLEDWLKDYDVDHQHPINIVLHKICVPAILFLTLYVFSFIPSLEIQASGYLAVVMVIFYNQIDRKVAFLMTFVLAAMLLGVHFLRPYLDLIWALGFISIAWIGQFIGHRFEKKPPSFTSDPRFLLIGPLWSLLLFRNPKLDQPASDGQ